MRYHQHKDSKGNVFGAKHPSFYYHKNPVTRCSHDMTVLRDMRITKNYDLAYDLTDETYRRFRKEVGY